MYFGEIEYRNKVSISQSGVMLPDTLLNEIAAIAVDLGVAKEDTEFLFENQKA